MMMKKDKMPKRNDGNDEDLMPEKKWLDKV